MKIYGLDEAGKGDIFGPLVIAGVVLSDKDKTTYKDSKKIRPTQIIKIAEEITATYKYSIRVVEPLEYNALYKSIPNQFLLMNHIYKEVIAQRKADRVVVDKFCNYLLPNVEYYTQAESKFQAVAAASIIAKAAQLQWFELHSDLHSGSTVDASKLLKNYNLNQLKDIAKLHFKSVRRYTNPDT